eukprot:UC1_evm1s934
MAAGKRPYVIGLTGGIASGKSGVAQRLVARGAEHVNADLLGHAAYAPGTSAHAEVIEAFGQDIVSAEDGISIDRRILGPRVFANPAALHRLNGIVWPAIAEAVRTRIDNCTAPVCVVEAAVLLEADWTDLVDEVWVCIVPPEEAVRRVMRRDGL